MVQQPLPALPPQAQPRKRLPARPCADDFVDHPSQFPRSQKVTYHLSQSCPWLLWNPEASPHDVIGVSEPVRALRRASKIAMLGATIPSGAAKMGSINLAPDAQFDGRGLRALTVMDAFIRLLRSPRMIRPRWRSSAYDHHRQSGRAAPIFASLANGSRLWMEEKSLSFTPALVTWRDPCQRIPARRNCRYPANRRDSESRPGLRRDSRHESVPARSPGLHCCNIRGCSPGY